MKICKDCKKEVSKSAKICPNCGKRLKMNLFFRIILAFVILSVSGAIISAITGEDLQEEAQKQQQEKYSFIEEPKLEEEGNEYYKTQYIVGTLKNNTNKKTNYVQIVFNLYDKDNNVVGSAFANINHIEADGTWKFKAMILEDEFDSFKFESVSGF